MIATEKVGKGMSSAVSSTISRSSDETTFYHVKNQDTLCRIAVNHNTTTSNLMKLNKLATTLIFPGQILLVPLQNVDNESNKLINEDFPCPIATTIEDAYAFLAPLTANSCSNNVNSCVSVAPKPFKDLAVVSSAKHENYDPQKPRKIVVDSTSVLECNSLHIDADALKESTIPLLCEDHDAEEHTNFRRNRNISIESCSSEPFEEAFLKINVHYLTNVLEHVHGILLITPTSMMFDPDPTCPLALEHGCERFGVLVDLKNVITLTMYKDTGRLREENISDVFVVDDLRNHDHDGVENTAADTRVPTSDLFALAHDFVTVDLSDNGNGQKVAKVNNLNVFNESSFELVNISDQAVSSSQDSRKATVSTSSQDELNFMYFCVRSSYPIMKTFSVLSALTESRDEATPQEDVKEAWFHVPRRNSDQLMAFFMQWSPDPYTLDFAEQNGFFMSDASEVKKKTKQPKKRSKDEVRRRSRSSTCSSMSSSSTCSTLESSTEEFVGNRKVEKEWELVSVEEAKRRSEINANELANDDTSLIPELSHQSNLINDHTLLELCKRMPARCIGCPWRLLYSTFDHGMSLKTLYRKMKRCCSAEDSPAFIIVQDTEGHIFGAFSSSRPRLSEHFYGSGESFLFTLDPEVEFFEWSGENNFFIKGHSDALLYGGGDGSAGLWIDEDLKQGRSRPCLTFNNNVLSSKEDFFIQDIEVWGFDDFEEC